MHLKYVRHKYDIVIFSPGLTHADVAYKLGWREDSIVSAGFIKVDPESICCFGRSISLDKDSKPEEDREKIARIITGY